MAVVRERWQARGPAPTGVGRGGPGALAGAGACPPVLGAVVRERMARGPAPTGVGRGHQTLHPEYVVAAMTGTASHSCDVRIDANSEAPVHGTNMAGIMCPHKPLAIYPKLIN